MKDIKTIQDLKDLANKFHSLDIRRRPLDECIYKYENSIIPLLAKPIKDNNNEVM